MKPEIYIQEEHHTHTQVVLLQLFVFFFFWKIFMNTKTLKTSLHKQITQQKKKQPPNRKQPFIETRDELNTVKPVNISSLSSLDQFTN